MSGKEAAAATNLRKVRLPQRADVRWLKDGRGLKFFALAEGRYCHTPNWSPT